MILVLATHNQGKAQGIKAILDGKVEFEIYTLADSPELKLPPETGSTDREKALFVEKKGGWVVMTRSFLSAFGAHFF